MNDEKKKSSKFLDFFDNAISRDEVTELFKQLTDFLKDFKQRVEKKANEDREAVTAEIQEALGSIRAAGEQALYEVSDHRTTNESELRTLTRLVKDEIGRLEKRISDPVDIAPLEKKINDALENLERVSPTVDIPATEVRDKIESLQGDERLDIDSISGITVSAEPPPNPRLNDLWIRA